MHVRVVVVHAEQERVLQTLDAMDPDVVVVRHKVAGVPHRLAEVLEAPVINAGDGMHAHPTQALLDAFTIRRDKGTLDNLVVDADDRVWLVDYDDAEVAAPSRERARDVAELLVAVGLIVGPERAVEHAVTELGAERVRFRALLESMSDAVLALDGSTRITLANPAAKQLLGQDRSPTGRLLLEVVRSAALAEVVADQ